MTWETVIGGALQGFSNFVSSMISIIGGSITPEAAEGLVAIFAISAIYRICQGGVKIPKPKLKKSDDEENEWVLVRRRK